MNSESTIRLVIVMLGLLALAVVIGGIVLTMDGKSLPGELIAIGAAAAGSIGSILAMPSKSADVRVVNDEHDPVPVEGTRPLRAEGRG